MDFLDILASTLHDTKNSLGMLSNTLAEVIERYKGQDDSLFREFNMLQYEIKRLNHNQIRLLSLYKAEKSQFTINIDLHSVGECIEEVVLQNDHILGSKGIEIETDCPEGLFWAFDRGLVSGLLDNVLNNAFRYARQKVRISAAREGLYLMIRLEDDGPGYPEEMLLSSRDGCFHKETIDFNTGSTGLGLYFSMLVAGSHTNKDRKGYISIANGDALGGGVFTLYIP
jgi:signal transduction histidine kinase